MLPKIYERGLDRSAPNNTNSSKQVSFVVFKDLFVFAWHLLHALILYYA